MVIVQLPDDLYPYLQLVIKRYSAGGIDPKEGQALFYLNDFVEKAQHIPDAEVQAAGRTVRPVDAPDTIVAPLPPPEPLNDGVRSLKRGDVDN